MAPKKQPSELEQLLGTNDPAAQAEAVRKMQLALRTPHTVMILRHNPIIDMVDITISGGQMSFDHAFHVLDLARKDLVKAQVQEEMKLKQEQEQQEVKDA